MHTLFKNGDLVRLINPENHTEASLIFEITDASNQDCLLAIATNSTLKMPPVEEFNNEDIEIIS